MSASVIARTRLPFLSEMAMKYDVEGHALLSREAQKLAADDRLAEQNELAEILLELNNDILYENDETGNWGDDVLRFVVLQVNHQVANMDEGFTKTSTGVGPLTDSYRSRSDGAQFSVHTLVADGLSTLLAAYADAHTVGSTDDLDGYIILTSMRNGESQA